MGPVLFARNANLNAKHALNEQTDVQVVILLESLNYQGLLVSVRLDILC